MKDKIAVTDPSKMGEEFWLSRATRESAEGGEEEPLSPAHALHEPLRHGVRRRVPFVATLNYGLTYSVPLHVRNLSPTDAYIEMPTTDLMVGASVEFVMQFRYEDRPVELRLPARVARIEADGVALQFGEYDDPTYTKLVDVLYTP